MARKLLPVEPGLMFAIPLLHGGGVGVGQVLSLEPRCLNSVLCAVFVDAAPTLEGLDGYEPKKDRLLCVQLTTRELLARGVWKALGHRPPLDVADLFPLEDLRAAGYVGAKVRGSQIICHLASAYHGAAAWDHYADADYLDQMLNAGVRRPVNAVLLKATEGSSL